MSYASPATFQKYGYSEDQIISFAGGWVNHESPEELKESYNEIINDKKLFHRSGGYPPTIGTLEVKQAITNFEEYLYGLKNLLPENIAIGSNSTQITFDLFSILLNPEDKILLLDPSYCNIPAQIAYALDARIIRFNVLDKETYKYNADEKINEFYNFILKEKPKVIFLISPDNPTSQVLSDDFVNAALKASKEIDSFVVLDLAYKALVFEQKYPKYFSYSPTENFITIHSNSKWCRGLGRRMGWIEAPENVIKGILSSQGSTMLCPDMLHGMAFTKYIEKALKSNSLKPYIKKAVQDYEKAAQTTMNAIEKHLKTPYLKPAGGLYTTIKVDVDGALFTEHAIKEQGILTVPGWGFGRSLIESVRICFGPLVHDLEKIEEGIKKLSLALNTIKKN
ncbi:hypothetical protein A2229_05590 [Candidatus Peregrinibacteria bacterium RIFOXYA2_FULL_33_7]|nr:MAG: hypothetical protein A2229_05590 [Candidatus Peregrinibacteria bacterium RIFOXYA2_FULL_33_7]